MYRFISSAIIFSFVFFNIGVQEGLANTATVNESKISSSKSNGKSIEEKINEMQLALEKSELLKEKSELEIKLKQTEKELEKLYILYQNNQEEFLKNKKQVKVLKRKYSNIKEKIKRIEMEMKIK